ncbi:MAG: hypothetical protein SAJ12_04955 [Jaaginema sp. PMC 1079.18]|nr:hypothetical protein [Jaaginema sp. PMC 1080.18]MEC4850342.1 hypothetical protein [Jaaginema sp. PMC 1079.18]MEC4865595.1 hypothetical protein [Jaaginema sp. PMC 1078.18]
MPASKYKKPLTQILRQLTKQAFLLLSSVILSWGVLGITETQFSRAQVMAAPQSRILIAYEKDWQKDLERKDKTVEKYGKSVEKYVEQAQQYNAANPDSKIDQSAIVGREVKSPREGRQRNHQGFFKKLFSSQSGKS